MRPFVIVTLDSCRFDSFAFAKTPFFDSLGEAYSGRSHADATLASHMALFSGQLPHASRWHGKKSICGPWIPRTMKVNGYNTIGATSLPFLNRLFGFSRGFNHYNDKPTKAIEEKNVALTPIEENLEFIRTHMTGDDFIFLNVGETHFPYKTRDNKELTQWEVNIIDLIGAWSEQKMELDDRMFRRMHEAQVRMVEYADKMIGDLASEIGDDAIWIVTADHGELFGEHHLYGHGHGCYPEEITVPLLCNDWEALTP